MNEPENRPSRPRMVLATRILAVVLAFFLIVAVVMDIGWIHQAGALTNACTSVFAVFLLYVARRGHSFEWLEALRR